MLLPILGDQYGRVLERGELQLRYEAGAFFLCYYEHELPIAPGTYRHVLDVAIAKLDAFKEENFYAELLSIRTALEYLPRRTETDPERIAERAREKEIIKRRLVRRCEEAPEVTQAIADALDEINGEAGDARSFDRLDELLNDQAYRLAFWRVAAEEINYRRFFDVNDLAAIRMERPEVFDATHVLVLELVAARAVTGLRIDHPDGLYRPKEYFAKLQQRCAEVLDQPLPADGRAIYLVAEKILSGPETLPQDWPVHGTTGYEFGRVVTGLLADQSAEQAITKTFHRFVGHSMHFGHLVYAKKRLVMRLSLANEVNVLGSMLDRLSEKNRWFRDFTLDALERAVRETIACFPVYRTYITPGEPVSETDRHVIERAITAAKRRNPAIEESVFNFLRDILLFRFPENLDDAAREEHAHFVLKFQQCTGPIMAKGLEDTAFYIYNRLAALNEVGGEPQQFGVSVQAFHEANVARRRDWPATLLATSTHDTKRSEDVRARMVAISEIPQLWRSALPRWRMLNRRWKKRIDDTEAPDANEEYLLYQTLLGTWPIDAAGLPAANATEEYIARIQAYMAKALNEAKVNTSWIQPNESWDTAMREFVAGILQPGAKNRFVPVFVPIAQTVAQLGAMNALAQVVLKMTAPGVPDIYQGNEMWDYSLVDPDNRRPVDYKLRAEMLQALAGATPEEMLTTWPDGRIKLFVTQRLLLLRRERPGLFRDGSYTALAVTGTHADSCVAFAREQAGESLIVLVPRLTLHLGFPPLGELWKDTTVQLPEGVAHGPSVDVFTGREMRPEGQTLQLSAAMATLPFAVYANRA